MKPPALLFIHGEILHAQVFSGVISASGREFQQPRNLEVNFVGIAQMRVQLCGGIIDSGDAACVV